MPYTPILGTLGYVLAPDGGRVLMIHRNNRADDLHLGKYNGLGGKLERDEDISAGMARELREEAGIQATHMHLRGTVNWPGFGKNGEDWLGFIFLITGFNGHVLEANGEGTLHWIDLPRLLRACSPNPAERAAAVLPLWPGDLHFVPLVFDADPRPFHGVMPYDDGRPVSWQVSRL
jgi:8-oxo-dGTP diphosphatase